MNDLTQGSIPKHLMRMALPIGMGMFVQTLYLLIDLYFVGQLGEQSLAGVSSATNAAMFVFALTQMVNVGTGTLIAHAAGRKDSADANVLFNQSLLLSCVMAAATLVCGYGLAEFYMAALSADEGVQSDGKIYLYTFLPSLALQFLLVSVSAAMRGHGIVKPAMQVQMVSIVLNILLTPIFIHGWLTGYAMGVAGAGLASSVAMLVAVAMLWRYFFKKDPLVQVQTALLRPSWATWKRLFRIGFPAGAEFAFLFVFMAVVYWAIQGFGASATAGFGLGSRLIQAIMLPAMAMAFALPAIAGQNFGAQQPERVKSSFYWSVMLSIALMGCITIICLWQSAYWVGFFSNDAAVVAVSLSFIGINCFNLIPTGVIFSCTGIFQGLGNTWPGLWSTAMRLLTFAVPVMAMSSRNDFSLEHVWYISVTTVWLQAMLSLVLVRRELRKRLVFKVESKPKAMQAITG